MRRKTKESTMNRKDTNILRATISIITITIIRKTMKIKRVMKIKKVMKNPRKNDHRRVMI